MRFADPGADQTPLPPQSSLLMPSAGSSWASQVANGLGSQALAAQYAQAAAQGTPGGAGTIMGLPTIYVVGGLGLVAAYLLLRKKKKAPAAPAGAA